MPKPQRNVAISDKEAGGQFVSFKVIKSYLTADFKEGDWIFYQRYPLEIQTIVIFEDHRVLTCKQLTANKENIGKVRFRIGYHDRYYGL